MRLIDADALIKDLETAIDDYNNNTAMVGVIELFISILEKYPTVEVKK